MAGWPNWHDLATAGAYNSTVARIIPKCENAITENVSYSEIVIVANDENANNENVIAANANVAKCTNANGSNVVNV